MKGNDYSGEERRRYPRIRALIYYYIDTPEVIDPFTRGSEPCDLVEIGLGGVRIYSDSEVPEGRRLHLTIFFPSKEKITAWGEVVWKNRLPEGARVKYEVGIKFLEIADDDRKILRRHIIRE